MIIKEVKKSLILYIIVLIGLIIVVAFNNKFWKLGKQKNTNKIDNNITYFESSNKIYNVPYEEVD